MNDWLPRPLVEIIRPLPESSAAFLGRPERQQTGLDALDWIGQDQRIRDGIWDTYVQCANCRGTLPENLPFLTARVQVQQPRSESRLLVQTVGSDPKVFPRVDTWLLYWAAVIAQERLAAAYTRAGSHEERLTGHLISELFAARDQLADDLCRIVVAARRRRIGKVLKDELGKLIDGSRAQMAYSDIAYGRREAQTGGDFGLIVKRPLSDSVAQHIPIRFQAKKVLNSPRGVADITPSRGPEDSQLQPLVRSRCGAYIYYYVPRPNANVGPIVPLVQSAEHIQNTQTSLKHVNTFAGSNDFATFLLSQMATVSTFPAYATLRQAVAALLEPFRKAPMAIVAMGSGPTPVWSLQIELDEACASYQTGVTGDPPLEPEATAVEDDL